MMSQRRNEVNLYVLTTEAAVVHGVDAYVP